jgi:hypothetical protein
MALRTSRDQWQRLWGNEQHPAYILNDSSMGEIAGTRTKAVQQKYAWLQ